jgi:hypothetical protein
MAGEESEFDLGDVKLLISGCCVRLRMAVFTLCHSNNRHAYLFLREDMLAFMESHRNYFREVGGVPKQMTYDNMKVAVRKFVGNRKEPTNALLRLSTFYGYRFRFCNKYSSNEKGHVEKSVEVIRDKAFALREKFNSIEEAQEYLTGICEHLNRTPLSKATENIVALSKEDMEAITPFDKEMGCFEIREYKTDKYSTFLFEDSHCSVPDKLVGQSVSVKIYSNKLQVYFDHQQVAEHERLVQSGWRFDINHYLNTLSIKPGALRHSEALRQAPKIIRDIYQDCFTDNPGDFIEMLVYASARGLSYQDIYQAYVNLKKMNVKYITSELMKSVLVPPETPINGMEDTQDQEIEAHADDTVAALTVMMEAKDELLHNNYI